jgi:hypothetical protein
VIVGSKQAPKQLSEPWRVLSALNKDQEFVMVEERITTVEGGTAPTTHTTIIHDGEPARRGSGATMMLVLLLIVALVAGLYIYNRSTSSESAKDNAVAEAASSVSDAAAKVGNAAENAADKVTDK